MPLRLTDVQLRVVMATATGLDVEKRDSFLRRLSAELVVRRGIYRPADKDVELAAREALKGLVQEPVA